MATLQNICIYKKDTKPEDMKHTFCVPARKYKGTYIDKNGKESIGEFLTIPADRDPEEFTDVILSKAEAQTSGEEIFNKDFENNPDYILEIKEAE